MGFGLLQNGIKSIMDRIGIDEVPLTNQHENTEVFFCCLGVDYLQKSKGVRRYFEKTSRSGCARRYRKEGLYQGLFYCIKLNGVASSVHQEELFEKRRKKL